MNVDWAFTVLATIIGFVVSHILNHLLSLRATSISREFEMRKEGKVFYLPLYGYLARLMELADGYKRAKEDGKTQILVNDGFNYLEPKEIIKIFKEVHKDFTKFLSESRVKGYELFIPKELAELLATILGKSDFLYEKEEWDESYNGTLDKLVGKISTATNMMEEIFGLQRKSFLQLLKSKIYKEKPPR